DMSTTDTNVAHVGYHLQHACRRCLKELSGFPIQDHRSALELMTSLMSFILTTSSIFSCKKILLRASNQCDSTSHCSNSQLSNLQWVFLLKHMLLRCPTAWIIL